MSRTPDELRQTEEGFEYAMRVASHLGRMDAAEEIAKRLRKCRKHTAADMCVVYLTEIEERLRNL